jgi:hypothetical protein
LARVRIPGPYRAEGEYEWDGEAMLPGGFIGLKRSPYLVWLVLESTSGRVSESAPKKIAVELDSVDLIVQRSPGTQFSHELAAALDELIDELQRNGMPGQKSHGKLMLDTPVFMVNSGDTDDDTSFRAYQSATDGCNVPLFARLWLKGKDGTPKPSSSATTGTRVLWRVQIPDAGQEGALLDERGVHAEAKAFIRTATSHEAVGARPPGGHGAFFPVGGKKAGPQSRATAGYYWHTAHPSWGFRVPDNRNWDAFSAAGKALPEGDVGISFNGGRLAGERYMISAIVDLAEALDVSDDGSLDAVPANQRSGVLTIDIWRRVSVVRSLKIGPNAGDLNFAPIQKEFNKAAVQVQPKPGLAGEQVQADWKRHYAALTTWAASDPFLKHAFNPDSGDYPVQFRTFDEYWRRAHADAGVFTRAWHRTATFFGGGGEDDYLNTCGKVCSRIYGTVVQKFGLADGGMTVVRFGKRGEHNLQHLAGFVTAGVALAIPGFTSRTKGLLFVFSDRDDPTTCIHEIGHTLFLAHAPGHWKSGEQPGGVQPNAHDAHQVCLMSYSLSARYLCGLCLLKLAGWNPTKIRTDGRLWI